MEEKKKRIRAESNKPKLSEMFDLSPSAESQSGKFVLEELEDKILEDEHLDPVDLVKLSGASLQDISPKSLKATLRNKLHEVKFAS